MAKGAKTVIEQPVTASVNVNPFRPPVIKLAPFVPGTFPVTASVSLAPSNVQDTASPTSWTNPTRLKTSTGAQNDLASGTEGISNGLDWLSASFGSALVVKDVAVRFAAMAAFKTDADEPGLSEVRAVVYANDAEVACVSFVSDTEWKNVAATAVFQSGSIMAALTAVLGVGFTAQNLQDLLTGTTADGRPKFEIQLVADQDDAAAFVGTFYAGKVTLEVVTWATAVDTQGAYQVDASLDPAFGVLLWTSGKIKSASLYDISRPRPQWPFASTVYLRAMTWDKATDTPGDWSDVVSLTTLSEQAARLYSDPTAKITPLMELDHFRFVPGSRWRRESAPNTDVVSALVRRSDELEGTFWISDVEENGVPGGYTIVQSVAAVQATEKTLFYDELNLATGGAGRVYVRLATSRDPGSLGDGGLGLILTFPVATRGLRCGPARAYDADPCLDSMPSLSQQLSDDQRLVVVTASGGGNLTNGDRRYHRLYGGADSAANTPWVAHRRGARIKLLGQTSAGPVPWETAPIAFDGVVEWDQSSLVSDVASFKLLPRDYQGKTYKLPLRKRSKKEHKNLADDYVGETIPVTVGVGHQRLELRVVDEARGKLAPSHKNDVVAAVYASGEKIDKAVGVTPGWTHVGPINRIKFKGAASLQLFNDKGGGDAKWTYDCDGELFEGQSIRRAPTLARFLMGKQGVPATKVNAASFTLLEGSGPAAIEDVGFTLDSEVDIADLIRVAAATGNFWIVPRADGRVAALPDVPGGWTANAIVLRGPDLMGKSPEWWYATAHMTPSPKVSCTVYTKKTGNKVKYATWEGRVPRLVADLGITGSRTVETYHTTLAGAQAVLNATRWHEPWLFTKFDAGREALETQVGDALILDLPVALDTTGRLTWGLFQVWEKQGPVAGPFKITARKVGVIPLEGRPL